MTRARHAWRGVSPCGHRGPGSRVRGLTCSSHRAVYSPLGLIKLPPKQKQTTDKTRCHIDSCSAIMEFSQGAKRDIIFRNCPLTLLLLKSVITTHWL